MQKIHEIATIRRKKLNMSQAQLARLSGTTQARVSLFEKGNDVKLSTARYIVEALDMRLIAVPKQEIHNIENLIDGRNKTKKDAPTLLDIYGIKDDEE